MKIHKIIFLFILLTSLSCVEKEYAWDDINKETLLKIPNIPLGDYEPITMKSLFGDRIPDHNLYIPSYLWESMPLVTGSFRMTDQYILKDVFSGDTNKNFFHEYMTNNFIMKGSIESSFIEKNNIKINIVFKIIDNESKEIKQIAIEPVEINSDNAAFQIEIPKEAYLYMQEAADLMLEVTLQSTTINPNIKVSESIQLKDIILETGGYLSNL